MIGGVLISKTIINDLIYGGLNFHPNMKGMVNIINFGHYHLISPIWGPDLQNM